jgi:hypothetical protein
MNAGHLMVTQNQAQAEARKGNISFG